MTFPSTPCSAIADAGHADARDERSDLETELVERDHQREQQDDDSHDPHHQTAHRRFERHPYERALDHLAHPPRDGEADDQDDDRAEDLKAVLDQETQDQIGNRRRHLRVMRAGRESRSAENHRSLVKNVSFRFFDQQGSFFSVQAGRSLP
ncbi:MAG TPA: hypothetical protein VNC82_20930 [Candidatus Limnocylindria bacterium]|nr:hypothetical protein [Candidatus Limnocylindria bacterium]